MINLKVGGMSEAKMKWFIDTATFKELFKIRRFGESGHPFFITGTDICNHFEIVYFKLRKDITDEELTKISKEIGWS